MIRYTYSFKKMCVELHRLGIYPETPEGLSKEKFMSKVWYWSRLVDEHGFEILNRENYKPLPIEERMHLIFRVLNGESANSVAISAGIYSGTLSKWVRKFKAKGYNGMNFQMHGSQKRNPDMKKMNYNNPREHDETEPEELVRLRAENKYIKAEIELIKKEIALREKKEAALLKAKKQPSSKSSEKKDIH